MKRSDRIDLRERGTVAEVLRWGREHSADRLGFLGAYLDELMRLCLAYDFDFSILSAQSAHETEDWTSAMWNQKGNPAGIGVLGMEGGPQGPNLSLTYASGVDAARAHVVHMYAYSRGRIPAGHELAAYIPLDPRYEAVFQADFDNTIEVLDDFNVNGRWALVAAPPYYGDRIISKGNEMFPDQEQVPATPGDGGVTPPPPPVTTPGPIPTTPTTWQGWFDLMFGKGKWTITQDWANDPPGREYDDLYDYGKGHGLDGQKHPGIDVGLAYNTPMYSPASATVVCAGTGVGEGAPDGGCGAYNDTGSAGPGGPKQGVGRIELYFPKMNTSLIFGHSRTAAVRPGQQVKMGDQIGGSGGMYGAHCHLEAVRWGTAQGYTYIDPKILLAQLQQGGTAPMPDDRITFGRVPMYGFTDKRAGVADKPEGAGWDNLGKRNPKFIVLHRMLGSLDGTDEYFGDPSVQALTDFGLGVRDMDGKSKAGWIYMWTDPEGYRSGWASGPVRTPYGDGKKIVDKYGIVAVNRDGVSVEISGKEDTPIDEVAWQELVHLCSWWVDHMKIPYNTRVNPATGANYLIWHEEFTLGTGKTCPFDVVKAQTNRLYNDISAFLQPYQSGGVAPVPGTTPTPLPQPGTTPAPEPVPEPQYAPPMPIPELVEFSDYEADRMKAIITTEGNTYVFVNDVVKAIRDTPRLQTGVEGAPHIGPLIQAGQSFEVTWMFRSSDGRAFYVSPYWSRILVSDTERVSDAA